MVGTKSGLDSQSGLPAWPESQGAGGVWREVVGTEDAGTGAEVGWQPLARQPCGACQEGLLQEAGMGGAAGGEVVVLLRVDWAGQDLG